MSENRRYRFNSFGQWIQTVGSGIAGLGVMGAGVAFLFNPVVGIVAAAYAAIPVLGQVLLASPRIRNSMFESGIKKGEYAPVDDNEDIVKTAKEISDRLGRPVPPKVYTMSYDTVAKMGLPLGFKWLRKLPSIRKMMVEKAMPKVYAALPGANVLLTTKEALAQKVPQRELEFTIAHEMSHLKVDGFSLNMYAGVIRKRASQLLMWGCAIAGGLALVGVTLPFTAGLGILPTAAALFGVARVAKAAVSFGTRVIERRADRNALYITRDLQGAVDMMDHLHEAKDKKRTTWSQAVFDDHPPYLKRIKALNRSFNVVSKYPALPGTPEVPPAAPANTQKKPLSWSEMFKQK